MPGLTFARRKMLERLQNGPLQRMAIEGSGGRIHNAMLYEGLIRKCDHPTVKDRMGYPADAYEITEAGRQALCGE